MVVGQAGDAGAEPDVARALGGGGDEDLGRGDQLPAGRVVLADPDLVVAEPVEPLDQLHVAVHRERGVFAEAVEGGEEDAELHSFVAHGPDCSTRGSPASFGVPCRAMSDKGIHLVREHLAKLPPSNTLTIEQRRAQYERAERVFPTPPDVKVETIAAPTRPAEWLTPPGVRTDAVVLYLHGGGYVIGSPRSHRHLAAALARSAGTRALLLDYRLAPEHPFPAAVAASVAAYQWLLGPGRAPEAGGPARGGGGGRPAGAAPPALPGLAFFPARGGGGGGGGGDVGRVGGGGWARARRLPLVAPAAPGGQGAGARPAVWRVTA